MASPNLSEIITTTLENRTGKLADNVTKNNALLARLRARGKVKPVSGGRTIRQEIAYAENGTFKRYSGYDVLNITPSDVFTTAEFNYAQAALAVSISGLEQLQNSGDNALIDLLEQRIDNAETTLVNNIAIDAYSDGTGDGGKQIGGLALLVPDAPTSGTVGGINRATWTFWRSQKFGSVADGGGAATAVNIQSYMNRLYLLCSRGADHPDLIVADNAYFRLYWESLQAIQRISKQTDVGQAGFDTLQYMGADVVFDGGYGGGATANHMWMLNTKYIFFRPHSDRNFAPMGGDRQPINQDAIIKLIGWAGNMTINNSFLQGALIA